MKLFIAVFVALSFNIAFAGQDTGGGDICENRIQDIRNDIKNWILKGGAKDLKFPSGITLNDYTQGMLTYINSAKINCVSRGDRGYPVEVYRVSKVCMFERKANRITCDSKKLLDYSESAQYQVIHHEYAGLAEIESPDQDESNYQLSSQITDYLVDQVVKRLAVKTKPTSAPGKFRDLIGAEAARTLQDLQDTLANTTFLDCNMQIVGPSPNATPGFCEGQSYWSSEFGFTPDRSTHKSWDTSLHRYRPARFTCNGGQYDHGSSWSIGQESGATVLQNFLDNGYTLTKKGEEFKKVIKSDFRITYFLNSANKVSKVIFTAEETVDKNTGTITNPKYIAVQEPIWSFTCNAR